VVAAVRRVRDAVALVQSEDPGADARKERVHELLRATRLARVATVRELAADHGERHADMRGVRPLRAGNAGVLESGEKLGVVGVHGVWIERRVQARNGEEYAGSAKPLITIVACPPVAKREGLGRRRRAGVMRRSSTSI